MKKTVLTLAAFAVLTFGTDAGAQVLGCEAPAKTEPEIPTCGNVDPDAVAVTEAPESPLRLRVVKYAAVAVRHKLSGLASYYSRSLDGTLTATGEIFRNRRFTAAHLTLPLGSWVEVTSRATG